MMESIVNYKLQKALTLYPAVALPGPRQSGKTTLALEVGSSRDALSLDLESELDRSKLASPELYLGEHLDRLVILDEVHRTPGLFPVLRGLIDKNRRAGRRSGSFFPGRRTSASVWSERRKFLCGIAVWFMRCLGLPTRRPCFRIR